ncbi:MAG TPA: hypothetical protein VD862_02355 [Candidatus Paceibacterota bacterium]|nr:hypothetical protein [Candidatus Paceibacterota bacterium]
MWKEFLCRVVYPLLVCVALVGGTIAADRAFASASSRNGGQEVYCADEGRAERFLEHFLATHPDRRVVAVTPQLRMFLTDMYFDGYCIVHEPVR